MTKKSTAPATPAGKKLASRIAVAQKQSDAAKKVAKLAKLELRNAKQKFKTAKHAAKKLRKAVKGLQAELAAVLAKKPVRKAGGKKPAAKRPSFAAAPVAAPVVPVSPPATDAAPSEPVQ